MYNPSSHPQVHYSLEALTKSLFYYLQTDSLEKITVSQICLQAGLTRRTFYRNCDGKEDLILYACDRLIGQLLDTADFSSPEARRLYRNFFSFWLEHRQFLTCVVRYDFYGKFVERYVAICNEKMRFPLQENAFENQDHPDALRRFCNSFLLGGLSRMLYAWAEEGFVSSVEDLTQSILFLVPGQGEEKEE